MHYLGPAVYLLEEIVWGVLRLKSGRAEARAIKDHVTEAQRRSIV
jgi:hypothetical protein